MGETGVDVEQVLKGINEGLYNESGLSDFLVKDVINEYKARVQTLEAELAIQDKRIQTLEAELEEAKQDCDLLGKDNVFLTRRSKKRGRQVAMLTDALLGINNYAGSDEYILDICKEALPKETT